MEREAFRATLKDGGEGARLVYADWLLDQGDPHATHLGEAIVAALQGDPHEARALQERLTRDFGSGIGCGYRFEDGLLVGIEITFLKYRLLRPLLRWHPLRDVSLHNVTSARMVEIATWDELSELEGLALRFTDDDPRSVPASIARLPGRSTLDLLAILRSYARVPLGPEHVKPLVSGALPRLRHLALGLPLEPPAVLALIASPAFPSLVSLDLRSTALGHHRAELVARALGSGTLREVVLDDLDRGRRGAFASLQARHGDRVVREPSWAPRIGPRRAGLRTTGDERDADGR